MRESRKTKADLISELEVLRARLADLEEFENHRRQTEEALKESEERYRMFVDNSITGICLIQDGNIRFVNKPLIEISGYSREELRGKPLLQMIHPDDREFVGGVIAARLSNEDLTGRYQFRVIPKNGDTHWVETFGTPVDYSGRPAILLNIIDINERKQAEKALKESEEKYRLVVENANEAIIVAQDGKVKFVNPKTLELTGYSREEFTSKLFLEFIHPDDREMVVENYLKRLRNEQIPDVYDFRVIDKDGNIRWAQINAVLISWEGRPATLNFLSDITERRRTEEALKESEELNRMLVDNSLTGIYVRQPEKTQFVNKRLAQLLGYTRKELLEMSFLDLIPPDDREFARQRATQRMSGERAPSQGQYRVITKNGEIRWLEAFGVPVTYKGKPAVLGNVIDITERKRFEEALKESEQRYRTVVEEAVDIICTIDLETGVISSANSFAEKALEYKLDEVVNKLSFLELVHPDDHERVLKRLKKLAFENDREPNFPLRLCKADGTCIDVEVNGAITNDPEGNPLTFIGVIRDVTDRKRSEEALRESEERYRTLVDNSLSGVCIIQDGEIQFVNKRLAEIAGYAEYELLGMPFLDLVHPLDRDFSLELAVKRLSGQPPTVTHQFRGFTKNGDIRWIETFGVLTEYAGRPALLVHLNDITDRRHAEEQLRHSEEKYRTLFEESKDIIYISTPEGRFLDINSAGVYSFGYSSKEEFLAIDIDRDLYMNCGDRDAFQMTMAEQGFVKDYELTFKRKGGEPITVLMTANTVSDAEGNIVAYRGIMRDITERKHLEQQLFQAQKMESMGTLAGGIAHDFNNLLTGILGYASLIQAEIPKDQSLFNYISTIEKSATRAAELTSQLLAFARGGKYEVKPVNINTIVSETLKIIERTFDKSIKIETRLESSLLTVEADAGQLQQTLMNLFVNSRDAMSHEGKLIIETSSVTLTEDHVRTHMGVEEGSYVILSVTDSGIGMEGETIQRIFEPFFTTKEKGKGTGLGLSMVYGVVKNHGGFVRVYSEPGEGSTFRIYLPASGKPEVKDSRKVEMPRGGTEQILVIDDEESVRFLSKDIFESHGYTVLLAENGAEAVELYDRHKDEIDMVILDMVMPKMGGRETFLRLKEIDPSIKALLSTGYSRNEKAQEILDSGVMGFIQKPYHVNELLSKVRNVLDEDQEAHFG